MDRVFESGAAGSPPSAPASPSTGYPTAGNPQTAIPATKPGPWWYHMITEELRALIAAAGLTPSHTNLTQVRDAIQSMIVGAQKAIVTDGATFEASVAAGEVVRWDSANSRYDEALADGTTNNLAVGIADVAGGKVYLHGECPLFTGLTPGARYYLSGTTPGAVTATPPADSVQIGIAKSATVLFVDIDRSPVSASNQENLIINGACEVAQDAAKNISTTPQYGSVDMFACWASGTVGAGSITQKTDAPIGRSGYALHLSGVTLTGSGVVYVRYRMEARDAKKLKNSQASFAVLVHHDVGAPINYTMTIRTPTVVDNFTSTTNIHVGAPSSVVSGAESRLSLSGVSMGDCSSGLEIEVKAECGAVTSKNFFFCEWIAKPATEPGAFEYKNVHDEISGCQRFFEKSFPLYTAPAQNIGSEAGASTVTQPVTAGGTVYGVNVTYKVTKRAAPTVTLYNPSANNAQARNPHLNADCSATVVESSSEAGFFWATTTAASSSVGHRNTVHWSSSARL